MRKSWMIPSAVALVAASLFVTAATQVGEIVFDVPVTPAEGGWYKGNTHAHTSLTDGDSPPDSVAAWYRSHGYDFLVITDHDMVTDPAALAHLVDSTFLLIHGEEVTGRFERLPVHVNGIDLRTAVPPQTATTLIETLRANVAAVRAAGGVPQINHPNFRWALDDEALFQAGDVRLFELYNGHPLVNSHGGGLPSTEQLWDRLLTRRMVIYGVATDDSHHFKGEFERSRANPGRGWVVVRADSLEAGAIARALDEGRFYASTGVELEDVRVSETSLEVHVRPTHPDFRYRIEFIGGGGRLLHVTTENPAVYHLDSPEPYVRARVLGSDGSMAWVQPVFGSRRR